LIVVQRQGRSRPNRYRKWRCSEDVLVIRPRVQSAKLKELAKQRVKAGQRLNGIVESPSGAIDTEPTTPDSQLPLLNSPQPAALPETTEHVADHGMKPYDKATRATDARPSQEALSQGNLTTVGQASGSLTISLQEALAPNSQQPCDKASLREKTLNTDSVGLISRTTAEKDHATAIEETDEVDAVACEIVDAVLFLAQRVEPSYRDERAWSVARRLAATVLEVVGGKPAAARAALLRAIGDRRLARASNPVGLLIRGIVGDDKGTDRYLLAISSRTTLGESGAFVPGAVSATTHETSTDLSPGLHNGLLDALRAGRTLSDAWLRERGISARALAVARVEIEAEMNDSATTPLADKLAKDDAADYRARLDRILSELELPAILRDKRALDHPMLLGMCRARLEAELRREKATTPEHKSRDSADRKAHQEKR